MNATVTSAADAFVIFGVTGASLAEGLDILHNADAGKAATADAETAPMEQPEFYQYDIDTTAVAEARRRAEDAGAEPRLLELAVAALVDSPDLGEGFGGYDEKQQV